jgi:hypothetical protein
MTSSQAQSYDVDLVPKEDARMRCMDKSFITIHWIPNYITISPPFLESTDLTIKHTMNSPVAKAILIPKSQSMAPAYLLRLPSELRLLVYDIVFAHQKLKAVPYRRHRGLYTNECSTLSLRLVNREIAEETFGYLFHTLDVTRLIGEARSGVGISNLNSILEGRWDKIHSLTACADDMFEAMSRDFVQNLVPGAFQQTQIDATQLLTKLSSVGWSRSERKVRTLTFNHFSFVCCMGGLDDFLLYLALLAAYCPQLTELRLVTWENEDLDNAPHVIQHCRIIGRKIRDWDTKSLRWMMPAVTYVDRASA